MTDATTIRPRANYQTAEAMRQSLIERIAAFLRATKMAKTKLGVAALNDGHAIKDIEAGRNLTLETYQRLDGFMTDNWPVDGNISPPTQPDSASAARDPDTSSKPAVLRSSAGEVEPD